MCKILIIDDNKNNMDLMREIVQRFGYYSLSAINGQDALIKIKQEQPDLIITDILMPNLNGFEFLERLKSDIRFKDIPIIIVSCLSDKKDVERCYNLGADLYITRPFKVVDFQVKVNKLIKEKICY